MQNKAVRLHGALDLRFDEFNLPPIAETELLVHVISDSLCMSSYKAATQGCNHKRIPCDVAEHPVVIGHEFCCEIVEVGSKYKEKYHKGQKFSLQTTLPNTFKAPGYSYEFCGGNTQYAIIPEPFLNENVITYTGPGYFYGSLAEPYSCVIGAFHANYHNIPGRYEHQMGIKEGGKMALIASTGPMGMAAIDYILNCNKRPSFLVVTGRTQETLDKCAAIFTKENAKKNGIDLVYVNTSTIENSAEHIRGLVDEDGFDDVFVFAPSIELIELGDSLLGPDGCLNFFAGPTDKTFSAPMNFYDVHYSSHHVCGTSGGNTDDMREAIEMMSNALLNPAALISHVGGLNSVVEATLHLPEIKGGKKLIYNDISLPLTAIADFEEKGKGDPLFAALAEICSRHNGLWSEEAEKYLLVHGKKL